VQLRIISPRTLSGSLVSGSLRLTDVGQVLRAGELARRDHGRGGIEERAVVD